jgi:hypothetical protein
VRAERFNPHFTVPEQRPPTDHLQLRQHFQFASEGRRDSLHHNPGPGAHNWWPWQGLGQPIKPPEPGRVPESQRGKIERGPSPTPKTPMTDPTPKPEPLRRSGPWTGYARDYGPPTFRKSDHPGEHIDTARKHTFRKKV